MKFIFKLSLILISSFFLSCATHTGYIINSVNIDHANFRVVGLASGSDITKKFFGIGGLTKNNLVFNAKKNMYLNYPLKKGQVYGNATLDFKKSRFVIYSQTQVTIHAEIIDFDTTRVVNLDSITPVGETINRLHNLVLGEEILTKNDGEWQKMTVTKLSQKNILLKYKNDNLEDVIISKQPFSIFKLNSKFDKQLEIPEYSVGQTIYKDIKNDGKVIKTKKGQVIALQVNKYLVDFSDKVTKEKSKDLYIK